MACSPSPEKPRAPLPATVVMFPSGLILRTRSLPLSARKRLPNLSSVNPFGFSSDELLAGPPSPANLKNPLPAVVVILPSRPTLRMRALPLSAITRFPTASTPTAPGEFREAPVAGPPSPEKPSTPLPATVVIMPSVLTFRIRLPRISATYKFPAGSRAIPSGGARESATVVIIPLGLTLRIRPASAMYRLPGSSTAKPDGQHKGGSTAGPPSSGNPGYWQVPLPATVVMIPSVPIRRMRKFPQSAM